MVTGTLTYFVVNISLRVTAASTRLSLSTVIANGIPISSVLAYFFPIVTPLLSVLHEVPDFFNYFAIEHNSNILLIY